MTATPNFEKVTQGMKALQEALAPFVQRELAAKLGGQWWGQGVLAALTDQQRVGLPGQGSEQALADTLDLAALLAVLSRNWEGVFREKLSRDDRTWVNELISTRNKWAHHGRGDMPEDDAWRALDTMARLLEQVQPTAAETVQALAREVRQAAYAVEAKASPTAPTPPPSAPTQLATIFGLKPWREVATPHPDVAGGRYQQAEFAADLAQVLSGKAEPEYQDPAEFFSRTYLTEGMAALLAAAVERVSGKGGEPVVQLKTAFGGGKTHTMLALYHLLNAKRRPANLTVAATIAQRAGAGGESIPRTSLAVLVGIALDPSRPRLDAGGNGVTVRTLWGELATQLGGAEAYKLVKTADEAGVSPGADTLVQLFDRAGPCVILIDELVAYARNLYGVQGLPAGSFDACMSFVQALTEAAKRAKRAMLVASIPESDVEVGGTAGQDALHRIEHTFGRLEAVWKPVGTLEGFEIVRRRLFLPVKDQDAREQTCLAFSRLYADAGSGDFPRECGEAAYLERLRAAYPIHPEVFDRLYEDWTTLPRFQKTRGVLRMMAAAIHELWVRDDRSTMILPGSIPMDAARVRDELTRYLPDGWNAVMERDVDGERSEPREIDTANQRFGQLVAARRVARAIFLGSAPSVRQQNVRGVDAVRVRLGVAQPGESIAVFNDALARLVERLQYLYSGNRRYWYDTQPNLRRTAEDRASRYDPHEVAAELERRLRQDRERGHFKAVHVCPQPADVPDEQTVRLVLLSHTAAHQRDREDSEALKLAAEILDKRGTGPRLYRTMLLFVAADANALEPLEQETRRYLAWQSIVKDADELNLDAHQRREAADGVKRSDETVTRQLREAYSWLLVPTQEGTAPIVWEATRIAGSDSPILRASKAAKQSGQLVTAWSPALLKMELDRYLWKDQPHLTTRKLWEYLSTYLYLSRLAEESVLSDAIRAGLPAPDYFGYAQSVAADGRYEGLSFATAGPSVRIDAMSVLVKPEIARRQLDEDAERERKRHRTLYEVGTTPDEHETATGRDGAPAPTPGPQVTPTPSRREPRRFHGTITLDAQRLGRDAGRVAEEVVQHLTGLVGSHARVTLEVQVELPEGAPEGVVRTVTENCRALRFSTFDFEEE